MLKSTQFGSIRVKETKHTFGMQRSNSRFKVTQQEALLTKGKSDWATNKMDDSTLINYKLKSKYAQEIIKQYRSGKVLTEKNSINSRNPQS